MTSLYLFHVSNNIHGLYICFTKIMNEIERICKPPTIKIQYRVRFVCLMFFVPLKNFSFIHHGDVTIIDKGPQILTYTRHLLPSSRATPIVTRDIHLYILEDRGATHTLCRAFGSGAVTTRLRTSICRTRDSNTQLSPCKANALTNCAIVVATEFDVFW